MIFKNLSDMFEQGYGMLLYNILTDRAWIKGKDGDIQIPMDVYNRLPKQYATFGNKECIPYLSIKEVNEALAHG